MSERDSYPAGVPCWVDNLVPDPKRAMAFYGELFGWEFDGPGPGPGDYYVARLRGQDVAGVGRAPEGVQPGWNTYVSVTSADDAARAAAAAGGRVVAEPFDVLPAGRLAAIEDPTGGLFGVWQAAERQGCQLVNEASAYSMSVLHTGEPETAGAFYRELFGWEAEGFGAPGLSLLRLPGFVGGEPQQPVPRDVVAVMAPPAGEAAPTVWAVGFWVTEADALANEVSGLGGSVVIPPFDSIPSRQALLSDPFGAPFSVSTAAH